MGFFINKLFYPYFWRTINNGLKIDQFVFEKKNQHIRWDLFGMYIGWKIIEENKKKRKYSGETPLHSYTNVYMQKRNAKHGIRLHF